MTDTGRVVPSIESDRTRPPWIVFWRHRFYGVDVPECTLPFFLWYLLDIDHVHGFYLGRELILASTVRRARFVILVARAFALFLGCNFAGLFDHPTVTVGVVGGLVWDVVDLAGPTRDFVHRGRAVPFRFRGLLPRS